MQRVCEEDGGAKTTTIIEVPESARDAIEARCKNGKISERNTDVQAKHVKACAAGFTLSGLLEAVERQVTALKG